MLSVIMIKVVMLSVLAPSYSYMIRVFIVQALATLTILYIRT
jgi:hypothetical protein